jgi:hypothetical protein
VTRNDQTPALTTASICEQVAAAKRGTLRIVIEKECLHCGARPRKPLRTKTVHHVEVRYEVAKVTVDVAMLGFDNIVVGALFLAEAYRRLDNDLKNLDDHSVRWIVLVEAAVRAHDRGEVVVCLLQACVRHGVRSDIVDGGGP